MSQRSITNPKTKFWLLSLLGIMILMLMVPAISFADGTAPDPPIEDPPLPPPTSDSVAPDDDPAGADDINPEDGLTKLEILLLTLLATF